MEIDAVLSLLGLALRGGRLVMGEEPVETVTQAYAKGTADKAALYAAQCARDEAAAALYQAAGTFAHQANGLNTLSGGWLAEEYDWMADTFAALFHSERLQAQEEANQQAAPEGQTAPSGGEELSGEAAAGSETAEN